MEKRAESLTNMFRLDITGLTEISLMKFCPIFSDEQIEESISPIRGIDKYGPYDVNTSDKYIRRKRNAVQIFALCPRGEEVVGRRLKMLIELLRDGYSRKFWNDVDFQGFEKSFRIKAIFPDEVEVYEPGKLREWLDHRNLKHEAESNGAVPLAIIGGTTHRSVRKNRGLYIESKKALTVHEIASQYASFYEYEEGGAGILYRIHDNKERFGYSLWTFSLNLYGKIGGLAWIVRQKLSRNSEKTIDLSLGLRFSRKNGEGKLGYYVGHVTVIDRFGRLVGVITSDPFTEIITEGMIIPETVIKDIVSRALLLAFSDTRVRENLRAKEEVNISIFNLYRFDPEHEIRGIFNALKEVSESQAGMKFKVGLISVISKPSYFLFDESGMICEAGRALRLNRNSLLIYTAERETGYVYPIVASIQNFGLSECTFVKLEEAGNHILALSNLHWQSAISGGTRLPAPLVFAQSVARMYKEGIYPPPRSWLENTLWFI